MKVIINTMMAKMSQPANDKYVKKTDYKYQYDVNEEMTIAAIGEETNDY